MAVFAESISDRTKGSACDGCVGVGALRRGDGAVVAGACAASAVGRRYRRRPFAWPDSRFRCSERLAAARLFGFRRRGRDGEEGASNTLLQALVPTRCAAAWMAIYSLMFMGMAAVRTRGAVAGWLEERVARDHRRIGGVVCVAAATGLLAASPRSARRRSSWPAQERRGRRRFHRPSMTGTNSSRLARYRHAEVEGTARLLRSAEHSM